MMPEIINQSTQGARKEHHCYDCDQPIAIGERYLRQFLKDGGDTWTYKAHEDCWEASWAVHKEAGLSYYDEWEGLATTSSDCHEWKASIAAFLRSKPKFKNVRRRLILTRLSWRKARQEWKAGRVIKGES